MTPQRRTALVSIFAAAALVALKLSTGLATDSLGLVSEALHSATDLAAAVLTFYAVGFAVRPADRGHAYGHAKAENLAALAEGTILVGASAWIMLASIERLRSGHSEVNATWYAFAVILLVIAIDASRAIVSMRAARRYRSAALQSNALHFASDLAGSTAVLIGLLLVRAGYQGADSVAALFVAVLVVIAAFRLMRRNVDALMDHTPGAAYDAAYVAVASVDPPVELRRLRVREAGGRHFADLVIGVSPGAVIGQAHAAADEVERAVSEALEGGDVIVHVEPRGGADELRERVRAAAMTVRGVREMHDLTVLRVEEHCEVSFHLKLPGDLPLEQAHAIASQVERSIIENVPEVTSVQTHLEPLSEPGPGERLLPAESQYAAETILHLVRMVTGRPPRSLRFLCKPEGLVVFLTLVVGPETTLADAHEQATRIERAVHRELPEVDEIIVHTEP